MIASARGALAATLIGASAAVVIVALAIPPFLSEPWMALAQGRAGSAALTGLSEADLRTVTGAIVRDLVLGPPDFGVTLPGTQTPALSDAERSHMRDVRGVFAGFYAVATAAALGLAAAFLGARDRPARERLWRRLSRAGTAVALVTAVGGGVGMLAFDQAFTVFHEIFFPGGNWSFDPGHDRLVQIFPDQFWSETALAVGATVVALALGLRWLGRRRAAGHADAPLGYIRP